MSSQSQSCIEVQVKEEPVEEMYPLRNQQMGRYMSLVVPDTDDSFLYCEECGVEYPSDCPVHGPLLVVEDKEVPQDARQNEDPSYCYLTLPEGLEIRPSSNTSNTGLGVFATAHFASRTRFGPYKGVDEKNEDLAHNSGYCWQLYQDGKPSHFVDARDPCHSNWMRFVNCARHEYAQCLTAYQHKGEIYYRAHRDIPPGTELLIYYGDSYALELNIPLQRVGDFKCQDQPRPDDDCPSRPPDVKQWMFEEAPPELTKAERKQRINARYQEKLKADPLVYKEMKKKDAARGVIYRKNLTEAQKADAREKTRLRNIDYRARKKAIAGPGPVVCKQEEKKEKNRLAQQKRRANMSIQKKRREKERSRSYYHETKKGGKSNRNGDVPSAQTSASPSTQTPASPSTQTPASPSAQTPALPFTQTPASPFTQTPALPFAQTPASPFTQTPASPSTQSFQPMSTTVSRSTFYQYTKKFGSKLEVLVSSLLGGDSAATVSDARLTRNKDLYHQESVVWQLSVPMQEVVRAQAQEGSLCLLPEEIPFPPCKSKKGHAKIPSNK